MSEVKLPRMHIEFWDEREDYDEGEPEPATASYFKKNECAHEYVPLSELEAARAEADDYRKALIAAQYSLLSRRPADYTEAIEIIEVVLFKYLRKEGK